MHDCLTHAFGYMTDYLKLCRLAKLCIIPVLSALYKKAYFGSSASFAIVRWFG